MSVRSQAQPNTGKGSLRYHTETLEFETEESPAFIKITSEVQQITRRSGIHEGQVFVFSKHTTAGIVIQEDEPLLLEDFEQFFENLAGKDESYRHNNFELRTVNMQDDECKNGHSHCRHLTVGPSETLPVADGELVLGTWQELFLLELDGPRDREVLTQVSGV